jgi:putative ABC transport system permease protein
VLNVQLTSASLGTSVAEEISTVLRERHHVTAQDDFSVESQQDILDASTAVTDALTLFLGGIAAIALVVGGIGIMNIMLVSVTERTREIGLRKAVGAQRRDILGQFLTEATALSLMGGIIGTALGWGVSRLVGSVQLGTSSITPVVGADAVVLAVGFSLAIGIFFGIYPAFRASALKPIEALRYE